ncbi:hypothetical protein LTS18_009672, partial [Coniosporium uncinatum]
MSLSHSRAVIRQQRILFRQAFRRNASTTETAKQTAEASKEKASQAQQGLSRVTSSAGSGVSNAGSAASNAISGAARQTNRMVGLAQSFTQSTLYYSRVALELGRIVFE